MNPGGQKPVDPAPLPDPLAELLAPLVQTVSVGAAGSAGDEIQQPGGGVGTTGQVDHAGELLRAAPERVTVVPDVLVDAQDLHALEPGRIACGLSQDGLDLGPECVPSGA